MPPALLLEVLDAVVVVLVVVVVVLVVVVVDVDVSSSLSHAAGASAAVVNAQVNQANRCLMCLRVALKNAYGSQGRASSACARR